MTSGLINYQYAAISEGVSQMRRVNGNIQQQVGDLQTQVKTLIGDFMGASSQSYDACASKITQDLNTSNDKLNTLSTQVNNGAENMNSADGREANRFAF
ncbi:WXG100 family type VII secretion target [Lentzea sp. JNUCC 0626]|uniref:WXG100 family type VII secretion target n=1 Tax=Lentzea sp. JNUCC 0626 TaxID=3367513 RepID=UPI003749A5C1